MTDQLEDLHSHVLVGDSFGAVIAIAIAIATAMATRRPRGLAGGVLSGGFAKNPITSPTLKDRLIGKDAVAVLLLGIADATAVVLPRTGHMGLASHTRAPTPHESGTSCGPGSPH